jgi:hypothetical protein
LIDQGKEILSHGYDDGIKDIVSRLNGLKRERSEGVVRGDVLEARR